MQLFYIPHLCGTALFEDPPMVTPYYGVDEQGPAPQLDAEAVIVEPPQLPLTAKQMHFIRERFDPLLEDDNHGIDNYVNLVNFVSLVLQYLVT